MTASVQAVLASALYDPDISRVARPKLKVGRKEIDDVLDGGFEPGRIVCISGESGPAKPSLCLNLVAEHLVARELQEVFIIDAEKDFDVIDLHRLLQARASELREQNAGVIGFENTRPREPLSEQELIMALDRVKVMQVFDFVGVVEALSEIRSRPEPTVKRHTETTDTAIEIADSEDEDDEKECVLEWPATQNEHASNGPTDHISSSSKEYPLIIFQGFDRIAMPLFRKDFVQGQASIASLLRSFSQLVRLSDACVIVTNQASASRHDAHSGNMAKGRAGQDSGDNRAHEDSKRRGQSQQPSIFASNLAAPLFGKTIDAFVDLHILLSQLPKTLTDAHICYSKGSENQGRPSSRYTSVHVLEVLMDKWSSRTGRWAAFQIAEGGKLSVLA